MINLSVKVSVIDLSNLPRGKFWREVSKINDIESLHWLRHINTKYQVIYGSDSYLRIPTYEVLEDNKPCSCKRYPPGSIEREAMAKNGWVHHEFDNFEDACNHLDKWLGGLGPLSDSYLPDVDYYLYEIPFRIRTING